MARKAKQWKPESVVLTYEEQAILNWYKAQVAFKARPTIASLDALAVTEEVLAQIGMDVNVKGA